MKLLAFDSSTEALSIAVRDSDLDAHGGVWHYSGIGGAQASGSLLPQILALLARAGVTLRELDAIVFGAGPGSFTGLRTACAVAQGLGFAAQRVLLPVDSLLAVAEDARVQRTQPHQAFQLQVALDARMDEMYVGRYRYDGSAWATAMDCRVLRPEDMPMEPDWPLAGNVAAAYGTRLQVSGGQIQHALPTATALLRLAPALLAAGQGVAPELAMPRYVRDKVAQTIVERAAAKIAAAPH